LLILGALVAMYIVLGVLYESLAHPPDHYLDLAIGRPRRVAGAASHKYAADRDRLCRHQFS